MTIVEVDVRTERNDQETCELLERLVEAGDPVPRNTYAIADQDDCPVCEGHGTVFNCDGGEVVCPVLHEGGR